MRAFERRSAISKIARNLLPHNSPAHDEAEKHLERLTDSGAAFLAAHARPSPVSPGYKMTKVRLKADVARLLKNAVANGFDYDDVVKIIRDA